MNCPACGLAPKFQIDSTENKKQCTGCGTKFLDIGGR